MTDLPLSARSEATTRRTYNRPIDDEGTVFETWEDTVDRAQHKHHRQLWEGAGGRVDENELEELRKYGLDRSGLVSGRTLWLGGTDYSVSRAASQFNCAGLEVATVYDMVDAFWLLLNGCGVGGLPRPGTLQGYMNPIHNAKFVPSKRGKNDRGREDNVESLPNEGNGFEWVIEVGDSGQAWAKALGKLLVSPRRRVDRLVLDFSQIRGAGGRLKGYGWISNGCAPLIRAFKAIHAILNRCAGNLLDEIDIGDVFNWCGDVLSNRRAAENLLIDSYNPRVNEFAVRKDRYWEGNPQRRQSNDSILFWTKPHRRLIEDMLEENYRRGDPGFVNACAALRRCPWFRTFNPCFEIILASHSFCNLVSISLPDFGRNFRALEQAAWTMARANYRQTCVDLRDGVLQPRWHQTNEALRLCGVSLTGVVQADWLTDYQIVRLRNSALAGAYSMADELGMPRPKAVCTIKPEGTRSKISGRLGREVAEGIHRPLGRYIFNWINFSNDDPIAHGLVEAGYRSLPNPSDTHNTLIRFPVDYSGCNFQRVDGKEVNLESAVSQLERYKRWNNLWCDYNVSCTVNFNREEIPAMADWIDRNWDNGYVATAFLARTDATKTAADLGHPYLPQEVITEEMYNEAMNSVRQMEWGKYHHGWFDIGDGSDCSKGSCPIK